MVYHLVWYYGQIAVQHQQSTSFMVSFIFQVVILIMLPKLTGSEVSSAKNILMITVILQYIPRLVRIIPLYRQIRRSTGIITETAWAGAAFNLLIYMLASHVILKTSPFSVILFFFLFFFLAFVLILPKIFVLMYNLSIILRTTVP